MSGEALYERYKDALRRGHVASLRGRLPEALTAYAEAATIAPERATPHTSAGTALLRRKRPADALRHYGVALSLVPRDEAALLGRAQALAALGHRPEAADAYDALAEVREGSGKLADAVDAARRALELAEGRERRRMLERLIERLRASEPGEPARAALEHALRVLEGVAMNQNLRPRGPEADPTEAEAVNPSMVERPVVETPADDEPVADTPLVEATATREAADAAELEAAAAEPEDAGADGVIDAEGGGATAAEVPVVTEPLAALDRELPADLDLVVLAGRVDDGLEAGTTDSLELVLDLATAYRRAGQVDAALDACYRALSIDPDATSLHLAIVELYDERGWSVLATEKLDLLDRLAALDGDVEDAGLVAAARTRRG
jgi:tetratricopeptide (TPR) repeat protein